MAESLTAPVGNENDDLVEEGRKLADNAPPLSNAQVDRIVSALRTSSKQAQAA